MACISHCTALERLWLRQCCEGEAASWPNFSGLRQLTEVCLRGFGRDNGGSIPSNVLTFPTRCNSNRLVINAARAQQLPVHGALYPVALAEHIISWQCPEGGLVVDPFGGYATTAWAAEKLERRWLTCELHWEYLRPALSRFIHQDGFLVNPAFTQLDNSVLRDCA